MVAQVNTQVATRKQDTGLALYGSTQEVQLMVTTCKRIAPWAQGDEKRGTLPMTVDEIDLVVRRSFALGLDPLNPHEVQIWVDDKGKICFRKHCS